MDSKEVKQALKEAREAIRQKEFKAALRHCKAALKVDKECYMAWVFVGAAAQEIDQLEQSVAAFSKAAAIAPDQILAWQGLCALYEKHQSLGDFEKDRHNVYLKLIALTQNDAAKQVEMAEKLTGYYRNLGKTSVYIRTLDQCAKLIPACKEALPLWQTLLDSSKGKIGSYPEEHQNLILKAHEQLMFLSETELPRREALCRLYIDALLQVGQREKVMEEVKKFGQAFADSIVPLEVLCGMYVDNSLSGWGEPAPSDDFDAIGELTSKRPNIPVGWLALATHLHATGDHEKALEALSKAAEIGRASREAHLLLSLCNLSLNRFRQAEVHARNGLACAGDANGWIPRKLFLCLAKSLCGQLCHEEAADALNQLPEECAKEIPILWCNFQVSLHSGRLDRAQEVLGELETRLGDDAKIQEARAALLIRRGDLAEAEHILKEQKLDSSEAVHLRAQIQWELGQRDESVQNFLEAARLGPNDHRNFVFLGKNYLLHVKDKEKALRCFQRAFQLNRASVEAGSLLSDVLCDLGQQEQNARFLEAITNQLPVRRAKWAWFRLGVLQLSRGSAAEAVQSLQNALRGDPNDKCCWECLGEAYLQRESLGAALLCFKKCLEANPQDLFALYQTATIKSRQGQHKDAATDFASVLQIDPDYVPALKGLAEANLALARHYLEQGLCGLGLEQCQVAVDATARAIALQGQLVCLWKVLGDTCLLPSILGVSWATLRLPDSLLDGVVPSNSPGQLLRASQRFYTKALGLKPRLASLWHDLGISLWLEARVTKSGFGRALASLRNAIKLSPKQHTYWNSLGVAAASAGIENYSLAQHCFIKSVETESDNPVAWTNLGALYLLAGNVQLSHRAFAKAQSLEPTAQRPWVGQGLVAEKVRHHDTVDLFRHCTFLGNHDQAACGYVRWLFSAPRLLSADASKTNLRETLVVASDALSRVVDLQGRAKADALNSLGLLLERQGLLRSARDSYNRALNASEQLKNNTEDVRVNLVRILCRLEEYDRAQQLVSELESRTADVLYLQGFVHSRRNETDEALKVYEEALACTTEQQKANVVLAMAMVTLKASGASAAKDLLLSRYASSVWSRDALEALFCLGLLTSDKAACHEALSRLLPSPGNGVPLTGRTVALLCCQHLLEGGDKRAASRFLSRAVHRDPANGALWSALAQALLTARQRSAVLCSLAAVALGERSPRLLATLTLARLLQGHTKEALRSAQKLLFLYPDLLPGWVLLGAALSGHRGSSCDKALQQDRFLLGADPHWKLWSSLVQVQYACAHQQWQRAAQLVPLVLWGYGGSPDTAKLLRVVQVACESLAGGVRLDKMSLDSVKDAVCSEQTTASWLVLSKLQQQAGNLEGAMESVKKAQELEGGITRALELQLRQALLALHLAKVGSSRRDELLQVSLGVLGAALRLNPKCRTGHLLLGVWALESDKERLAKKSLERLTRFSDYESPWSWGLAARLLLPIYLRAKDTAKLEARPCRLLQADKSSKESLGLTEEQMSQLISMGFIIDGLQ
ncbi:unnamed protein product [Ixodes hexagonus]